MKTVVAVSRLYRGVVIMQTMEGIQIPALAGDATFDSWEEAEAFIDGMYAFAWSREDVIGDVPAQ